MSANNKISTISNQQLPFFIQNDHPELAVFIKKYYEFLEQSETTLADGHPIERTINFLDNIDIDRTSHDDLAEELYKKFIHDLPKTVVADKKLIMKHIKDFYRARGSEKATLFLVNILTGDANNEIYYPKTDILKASDGKWSKKRSIRINSMEIDGTANTELSGLRKFVNTRVVGSTSNASAIVETVNRFYQETALVSELFLSQISGTFQSGEMISTYYVEEGTTHTLTANTFPGYISDVLIYSGGTGYSAGDYLTLDSNVGSGGLIQVSTVSAGNIRSIAVLAGGAGFQNGDTVLVTGAGSGANAYISSIDESGNVHANSYTFYSIGTIGDVANVWLGNTYTNLNSSNVNTAIQNALSTWVYANTGPALLVVVDDGGAAYGSNTGASISGNSRVRSYGVLGLLSINSNGTDYEVGDELNFYNVSGGYGTHAYAQVTEIDANGGIADIEFVSIDGMPAGGVGYTMSKLPTVSIVSANGTNANVTVTSLLGYGDTLAVTNSNIGVIETVTIVTQGTGYDANTTINVASEGNGDANLSPVIVRGIYTGPGRYLNDDGFLSSHNFLRGPHYYQNYSYVLRTNTPLKQIKKQLLKLANPAGMKLFSTLKIELEENENFEVAQNEFDTVLLGTPLVPNTFIYNTNWTVAYVDSNTLSFNIVSMVANNYSPIQDLEYRLDSNTWVSTGKDRIGSFFANVDSNVYNVEIRAVNEVGNGANSVAKYVTYP